MRLVYTILYSLTPVLLSIGYYFHSTQDLAYKILSKEKHNKKFYSLVKLGAPGIVLLLASNIFAKNHQLVSYLSLTFLSVAFAYSRSSFLKMYTRDNGSEIEEVETRYRTITYLVLLFLYILKNGLTIHKVDLPYFLNTITESLLTFVIIDTLININKNLNKKLLMKLKKISVVNLENPENRFKICLIFSIILILITQNY